MSADELPLVRQSLWRPYGARGVFGGQVIGQAVTVSNSSVPDVFLLHVSQNLSTGILIDRLTVDAEPLSRPQSLHVRFSQAILPHLPTHSNPSPFLSATFYWLAMKRDRSTITSADCVTVARMSPG